MLSCQIGGPMCDKCKELDEKIARYSRLSASVTDEPTIDRFTALIEELETQKIGLHAEQEK
jgi:hypothetical protein